jgi:hypothetical protein
MTGLPKRRPCQVRVWQAPASLASARRRTSASTQELSRNRCAGSPQTERKTNGGTQMKGFMSVLAIALALFLSGAALASTTIHGTFTDAQTSCLGVVSPAPLGTVDGTWNLNVKQNGQAEISIVIFRDGTLQANWASVVWSPALDNDPGTYYHYLAVVAPTLTLDVTYTPSTDLFVFRALHLSSCIGPYHADQVEVTGSSDRGSS